MVRNESAAEYSSDEDDDIPLQWRYAVYTVIMVLAFLGNTLLITALIKIQRRHFSLTNLLLLNLALSDTLLVASGVAFVIIRGTFGYLPIELFGCHFFYPLPTYCVNSVVMTLVCLSIERFTAVLFPFRYYNLKKRSTHIIFICHLISFACTLPYAIYNTYNNKYRDCEETWSNKSGAIYTIFLCVIQYLIPLPLIMTLYTITWLKVKQQNDKIISLAKKQIRMCKRNKEQSKKIDTNTKQLPQTALKRQRQTMEMLQLFIIIAIVFTIFKLPNQISWLLTSVANKRFSIRWRTMSDCLTYTNSIVNPIIYGFNKKYQRVYISIMKQSIGICLRKFKIKTKLLASSASIDMRSETDTAMYYTPDATLSRRYFSFRRRIYSFSSMIDLLENENSNNKANLDNDFQFQQTLDQSRKNKVSFSKELYKLSGEGKEKEMSVDSNICYIYKSVLKRAFNKGFSVNHKPRELDSFEICSSVKSDLGKLVNCDHKQTDCKRRNNKCAERTSIFVQLEMDGIVSSFYFDAYALNTLSELTETDC